MNEEARAARRRWPHSNLNRIPVALLYDFELPLVIANDSADGFRASRARIAAAKRERRSRERETLAIADAFTPPDPFSRKV